LVTADIFLAMAEGLETVGVKSGGGVRAVGLRGRGGWGGGGLVPICSGTVRTDRVAHYEWRTLRHEGTHVRHVGPPLRIQPRNLRTPTEGQPSALIYPSPPAFSS